MNAKSEFGTNTEPTPSDAMTLPAGQPPNAPAQPTATPAPEATKAGQDGERHRLIEELDRLRIENKAARQEALRAARDARHAGLRLEQRERELGRLRDQLRLSSEALATARSTAAGRLGQIEKLEAEHKARIAELVDRHRQTLREAVQLRQRANQRATALEQQLQTARDAAARTKEQTRETLAQARSARQQLTVDLARRDRLLRAAELRCQRLTTQVETLHRRAAARQAPARTGADDGDEPLPRLIARGMSVVDACVRQMRSQLAERARVDARAFAHALMDDEVTAEIGTLCSAIHAHADGFRPLARHLLAKVRPDWVNRHAAAEWIDVLLADDLDAGRAAFTDWFAALPAAPEAGQLARVAQRLAAHRQLDLAGSAVARLEPLLDQLDDRQRTRGRWLVEQLARWRAAQLEAGRRPAVTEAADGKIRFGILDYKMLDYDKASSNIGDHVQTLASLSNLVRFSNLEFTSREPELANWVERLRARLDPERAIDGPAKEVELVLVDRDFSHSRHYAEPTWMLAFGWYMHPNFRDYFDFPFAPNLRPIFVSFHVNRRALLTPEAVDYLKANGPIGCRDWTTVYLLRDHGIEAFFSGCITTTVGKVFPRRADNGERKNVALVDYQPEPGEFEGKELHRFTQVGPDVRHRSFCQNMDDALALLESYRSFERVATSRLHCYLPTTALGLDVVFKPRNLADVRFEGLIELGEQDFARIRDGIETKLARVLGAALAGADEAEVRQIWRDACAADLAFADEYCKRDIDLGTASFDPAALAAGLRDGALHGGRAARPDDIQVAFAVDHNLGEELPVVLESALAHAGAPLHVHVMTRGLDRDYWARLIADFGDRASLSFYAFDAVDYGDQLRMLVHTTVSTMDRLMLPDLLPDVSRIIYLDVDIVVLGDLAELWAIELGNAPIAGKSSTFDSWRYGSNMVYRAAGTLPHHKAWQLRRAMHAQGPLTFPAFNAGVLVLNLARMRADDFARRHVPLIERYGMNDQDALNVYARGERVHLGLEWNAVPSQDVTDDARILHYAGPVKPWAELVITRGREFNDFRTRYLARTGRQRKGTGLAQQQISTVSSANRHPHVLEPLARLPALTGLGRPPRILSFGCSVGHECLDLVAAFPGAEVFGCDVDPAALAAARERCAGKATIFESSHDNLAAHGPYDLVTAFNVFCRYPQTAGHDQISAIYPIAAMNEGLLAIDTHLLPGAVLALYNSPYFFEDTVLAERYEPSGHPGFPVNAWMEKCDASGRRVTDVHVIAHGQRYSRDDYTRALREQRLNRADGPSFVVEQVRLPDAEQFGSLHEIAWIKRR